MDYMDLPDELPDFHVAMLNGVEEITIKSPEVVKSASRKVLRQKFDGRMLGELEVAYLYAQGTEWYIGDENSTPSGPPKADYRDAIRYWRKS